MKKSILALLYSNWQKVNPSLKKKILVGIGMISVFAFIIVGAFSFALFKAGSYLITQIPDQEQIVNLGQNVKNYSINSLDGVLSENCLDEIRGLLSVNTWLTNPVVQNSDKIVNACFVVSNLNKETKKNEAEYDKNKI